MNRLIALVRREFWENKGALRTTPLVIGGIYIAFLLMGLLTMGHFDNEMYTFREAMRMLAKQPVELRAALDQLRTSGRSDGLDLHQRIRLAGPVVDDHGDMVAFAEEAVFASRFRRDENGVPEIR